jgi:hypothetical protein
MLHPRDAKLAKILKKWPSLTRLGLPGKVAQIGTITLGVVGSGS